MTAFGLVGDGERLERRMCGNEAMWREDMLHAGYKGELRIKKMSGCWELVMKKECSVR